MPSFISLNETFLDESVQSVTMRGYKLVSRLDRRSGESWGGICFFARNDLVGSIAHIADSLCCERSWHVLHSDHGPILIGIWYRPPCYGEVDSIHTFLEEWRLHSIDCTGTIVIGDLNVHNKAWLQHSSRTTPEGRLLAGICNGHGLSQVVGQPTRGEYTLDLALSDLPVLPTAKVLPKISDHNTVLLEVDLPIPVDKPVSHEC